MAYQFEWAPGQSLWVELQGEETAIALLAQQVGQQQGQHRRLTTGAWQLPPTLFRVAEGLLILQIEGSQGQFFVQVQNGSLQTLGSSPSLAQAELLIGHQVQAPQQNSPPLSPMQPMQPLQPMQPMKPMQMGNLEMQMNPMQMRMGDLEMQMPAPSPSSGSDGSSSSNSPAAAEPQAIRQFCSQCGQKTEPGDRFCAYCGHPLVRD